MNKRFLIEGSQEREKYLSSLCHALSHVDTIVRAYCLMSNHVGRFLSWPEEVNTSNRVRSVLDIE